MNIFGKITIFLKEVWSETKKVNWPAKNEVLKCTLLVLIVSIVLAVFLGGVDFVFTRMLNWVILQR